jgi:HPt (histidine-containing phosphotransfer) domain-containing protein
MNSPRPPATKGLAEGQPAAFELSAEDQRTLMRLFLQTTQEDLQRLERALQDAAPGEMLHRVHRLHGAALTVGATPMIAELEGFEKILQETLQVPADSEARLMRLHERLRDYQLG